MREVTTRELFAGKKVVLFAVPGAFTPTCSTRHLPGFVKLAPTLREKGVDEVACVSVNDAFVMDAWSKSVGTQGEILMLADGSAKLARELGVELDLTDKVSACAAEGMPCSSTTASSHTSTWRRVVHSQSRLRRICSSGWTTTCLHRITRYTYIYVCMVLTSGYVSTSTSRVFLLELVLVHYTGDLRPAVLSLPVTVAGNIF